LAHRKGVFTGVAALLFLGEIGELGLGWEQVSGRA
jgi:hypothetical protein